MFSEYYPVKCFSPPSVVRANVNGESLGDILLWIFIIILSVIYLSTSHLAFSLSAGITLDFEEEKNKTKPGSMLCLSVDIDFIHGVQDL